MLIITLLITICIEICSSAVMVGHSVCLTGNGPYFQVFGGQYDHGGCSTPGVSVIEVPDGNGGFTWERAPTEPALWCSADKVIYDESMDATKRFSLKTYVGGENNEKKYIMISLNRFADENYELYCNTDPEAVAEAGFNNPVPLDSDPTLLCGGRLANRASLRSIQLIDGDCMGLCEEPVFGICEINARTGRGISSCCEGSNRKTVSYREGCDESSGFVSYTVPDPICCPVSFLSTECGSLILPAVEPPIVVESGVE